MHKHLISALNLAANNAYDKHLVFNLCAVIVGGGSIISVGYNKSNTNGFVEHYTDKILGKRDYALSSHAEMDSIAKVRSKTNLVGCKVFVARRSKEGNNPVMARPCPICQAMLRAYGIKRAFYTIDSNRYGIMNLANNKPDEIVRF